MADEFTAVTAAAAEEAGVVDASLLGSYLAELDTASATGTRLDAEALANCQLLGGRAAEQGVPLRALIDLYLSATWRAWRLLPAVRDAADLAAVHTAGEAVLRAADDAVAAVAEGYQAARRWVIRREEAARREFVDDLLSGAAEPSKLLSSAEQFGLDVVGRHLVVVCTAAKPFRDATPTVSRVEAALVTVAGEGSLVATKDGQLVCVLPDARRDNANPTAHTEAMVKVVATALEHALTPGSARGSGKRAATHTAASPRVHAANSKTAKTIWRCGVGRVHAGPAGVVRSYDEAKDALQLAALLDIEEPVVSITDLLVYRVLLRDRESIDDLIDNVLTPLRRARGGAGPLLETIAAYAATGANAAATARRLHLSVRAVTYRLSRIHELTRCDPGAPDQLYVLQTAALGARLVGWPH